MTRDTRRWSYQQKNRDVFKLLFGRTVVAELMWGKSTMHEHRTMLRIVEGLNDKIPYPRRTWDVRLEGVTAPGELAATLLHNGDEMATLTWTISVHRPERWPILMLDGLNRPGTIADPVPEPAPPTRLRRVV